MKKDIFRDGLLPRNGILELTPKSKEGIVLKQLLLRAKEASHPNLRSALRHATFAFASCPCDVEKIRPKSMNGAFPPRDLFKFRLSSKNH